MSFILDALKKSEHERQRQSGPSLADIRVRRRHPQRPWWAIAVAVLLAINLGVLVIVLARNGDRRSAQQPAPAAQAMHDAQPAGSASTASSPARSATRRANAAPRSASASQSPAVRSLAEEADPYGGEFYDPALPVGTSYPLDGFDDSAHGDPGLAGIQGSPTRRIEAPAVAPAPQGSTLQAGHLAAATPSGRDDEMLPTPGDVIAGGTPLPDMHLDIHVYSGTPSERFVFVNMRKYIEGQSLSEGPQVERITPDGAILNHRGQRFLLPRR